MQGLGAQDPPRLGPYRLRAVVGDGGMGRVYLGTSEAGRLVAVKVIGPGLAGEPGYRQRFAREARAAMSVSGVYTAGTAVLHDASWLPDSVRALIDLRRAEVQRVLGEQRGPLVDPAATVLEPASGAYGRPAEQTHSALAPTPFLDMEMDTGMGVDLDMGRGASGRGRPAGWVLAVSVASAALIVIAVVVAVLVFRHDGLSANASSDGPLNTGSPKKAQTATATEPAAHASTSANRGVAGSGPSSAPAGSSAEPMIYPVDRVIATDTAGDTETVQSVIVDADGTVQVKLVNRAAADSTWTCAYSKAGELTLSTANGTPDPSTGSDCTGDPTKIWVMTAGELWTNTEYFSHVPDGSGPWTITALQRAYQGQLSGIDIPATTTAAVPTS